MATIPSHRPTSPRTPRFALLTVAVALAIQPASAQMPGQNGKAKAKAEGKPGVQLILGWEIEGWLDRLADGVEMLRSSPRSLTHVGTVSIDRH